jgi:hypothetical protein
VRRPTVFCVQANLEAAVESMQYELYDPEDPDDMARQQGSGHNLRSETPPVVILGFNEASQACSSAG